ncbi:MAG: hypothetical protein PsegKO_07100 [Pseudohongiellaceae bacterium]
MPANALFYKLFQVFPELIYTYCFHRNHQYMYGNAVQEYSGRPNNRKQCGLTGPDAHFVRAAVAGR